MISPEFKDKRGVIISDDDILLKEEVFYRYIECDKNGIYLLSCDGYSHNLTADLLLGFINIGKFSKENEHLFNCD